MENIPTWIPVVAAAISDGAGLWLMHRRPENKDHGGLWEFPGGKVEASENPTKALVREIREELSVELDEGRLIPAGFAESPPSDAKRQVVILLYICDVWEGSMCSLEGGAVGWFTPDQIRELPKPPLDVALAEQLFEQSGG